MLFVIQHIHFEYRVVVSELTNCHLEGAKHSSSIHVCDLFFITPEGEEFDDEKVSETHDKQGVSYTAVEMKGQPLMHLREARQIVLETV